MGPLIAIVGSDGSGKSTVGAGLLAWLRERRPAELCHLGKQSGNLARAIGQLPVFGSRVERAIDTKAQQANAARRVPGPLAALIIYGFSLRRLWRFLRMLALRRRGVAIVADRFPQVDLPAAIDGPGFGRVKCDSGLSRRLAAIERRQFAWMTSHRPDLVIRLNVDLATAIARKPDHKAETLAVKVADIGRLHFAGAPIVDIDANRPLDAVLDDAKAAVAAILT